MSTLVSRNITVMGRRTSVRLEPEMWACLREIAERERCKIHDICTLVNVRKKQGTSLTAAIRVFVMLYYRAASTEAGHLKSGHGNFASMLQRAKVPEDCYRFFSNYRSKTGRANDDSMVWMTSGNEGQAEGRVEA